MAVAPDFGSMKPSPPDGPVAPPYPEKVTTLGWTTAGVHVMSTVTGLELSRPAHEFEVLVSVAVPVPLVMAETFEPDVTHPAAFTVIDVDSAVPPLTVSAGENVREPVMLLHVTPPEATMTVATGVLGLELQAVANTATGTSATRSIDRVLYGMDMTRPPDRLTRSSGRPSGPTRPER